jgi:iron complex outermembrane receptor protein
VPIFEIQGLTIMVPRPVSTTGGASAVDVLLDSLVMQPAPTLEQVLREMPLIQIRRNSRGEAQPALRGGEDRQIAVLFDGVPITLGWDARTDLSVIPMTSAQRISIIRGLSSVLHGPNVLGGVIEIDVARGAEMQTVPRAAQFDLGLDHTGARSLAASAGSMVGTSRGSWIFRGGAGHQARDGVVLPDGAPEDPTLDAELLSEDGDLRLNTDASRYDGFFSARYRSEEGTWMSLSASGYWEKRGVAPEAHVQDPRLWRYPARSRILGAVSGGTGQRMTPWGEGDLEASFGLDLGSTEIDQFATAAYGDKVGGENSDDWTYTLRLLGDHSLGSRGEIRTALTYADVNHDEVLDGVESNTYRQRLWSLGTEAEWQLSLNPDSPGSRPARFSVGFAVDGSDTPETGDKPSLETLWDWGGRIGFTTFAGRGDLLFHGSLSRRTRFPALRELYSGALGRFIPNPDLEPEALTGGEAGFTLMGEELEVQAVAFYQVLSDGIVRSSVSTPEGRKFKRINQDEIRSRGIELLASGRTGPVAWSWDLTLQRTRGVQPDGDEVKLEYEPGTAGKLSASFPLPLSLEAGFSGRFVGRQYCENPEAGGLVPFDSSRHLDLRLGRVFGFRGGRLTRAQATVHVDNATDALVLDQCGLPQPGRTLRVQFRIW